jgi:hypothetical protein
MEPGITWYEVLGVLPGAAADKIERRYGERTALLRGEMIAGAPSNVLVAVRRAQEFLDGAWEVLGDPAIRERYDEAAGFRIRGGGLPPAGIGTAGTYPTGSEMDLPDTGILGDFNPVSMLGSLLAMSGWVPGPRRAKWMPVPDVRGLFYDVSLEVAGRLGLHVRSVRLTPRPMPVDGLVVDQSPRALGKVRRGAAVTVHVWHPPARPGTPPAQRGAP